MRGCRPPPPRPLCHAPSEQAALGVLAGAESVVAEASWEPSRDGQYIKITTRRIVVADRSWEPADRQDKAIRVMGGSRPVFLDEDLFVLRGQIPTSLFIFERA